MAARNGGAAHRRTPRPAAGVRSRRRHRRRDGCLGAVHAAHAVHRRRSRPGHPEFRHASWAKVFHGLPVDHVGNKWRPLLLLVVRAIVGAFGTSFAAYVALNSIVEVASALTIASITLRLTRGSTLLATLAGCAFVVSRFAYYNLIQVHGIMEGLALLLMLLALRAVVVAYQERRLGALWSTPWLSGAGDFHRRAVSRDRAVPRRGAAAPSRPPVEPARRKRARTRELRGAAGLRRRQDVRVPGARRFGHRLHRARAPRRTAVGVPGQRRREHARFQRRQRIFHRARHGRRRRARLRGRRAGVRAAAARARALRARRRAPPDAAAAAVARPLALRSAAADGDRHHSPRVPLALRAVCRRGGRGRCGGRAVGSAQRVRRARRVRADRVRGRGRVLPAVRHDGVLHARHGGGVLAARRAAAHARAARRARRPPRPQL